MYSFSFNLSEKFEDAVARVGKAMSDQGFAILTKIDVKETLKAKLDLDREPCTILGACYPPLARSDREANQGNGLLLPCKVFVRQEGDGLVTVAFMDTTAVPVPTDKTGVELLASKGSDALQTAATA